MKVSIDTEKGQQKHAQADENRQYPKNDIHAPERGVYAEHGIDSSHETTSSVQNALAGCTLPVMMSLSSSLLV
jgi:hypothetical protein